MAVTLNASTSAGLIQTADTTGVISLQNNGTTGLSLTSGNLQFNSGYGSVATAYGCRAWVNFNGTGTVAIRGSGNVTSITDNGTGNYTVNMTTAMPDVNYTVQSNATNNGTARANTDLTNSLAVGSFVISTTTNGTNTPQDSALICVSVFR